MSTRSREDFSFSKIESSYKRFKYPLRFHVFSASNGMIVGEVSINNEKELVLYTKLLKGTGNYLWPLKKECE